MKITCLVILFCSLFLSHLNAQEDATAVYEYIFPKAGAKYVHPNSTIILRFNNLSPKDLTNLNSCIKVNGDKSGELKGTTIIASDKQTIIFQPKKRFVLGETVRVTIEPKFSGNNGNTVNPLNYRFTVLNNNAEFNANEITDNFQEQEKNATVSKPQIMSNGVAVPANFPHVTVTNNGNHSNDYVFAGNWSSPNYNIIFDTSGEPVWYMKTAGTQEDFKVQPNGWITMLIRKGYDGLGMGHVAYTQNFEIIKLMRATNGYTTNMHDFYMLPDNGYILIGQRNSTVDMSEYVTGGHKETTVIETCIQEFTANDELIFIWRSWDHFDIRNLELENLTSNNIRFPHINAVDVDEDGHLLISSRHLSEISKINRQNGEFIWRMSGIPDSPNNDFEFVSDPLNGFRNQHAIRSLGNNRYSLFDNGNLHPTRISRTVEYEIDTVQKTATLLWEYRNTQDNGIISQMGNSQRLHNGNTHINWAFGNTYPIASEITPNGETVFEMRSDNGYRCYRTFRYPWNGKCKVPYLLLEPQVDNLTLIFNKFGDKNVSYYKIYGDTIPNPTTLIDTCKTTFKQLTGLKDGSYYFFRVTAIDRRGRESEYSNEEHIYLGNTQPGKNLIKNGDFINDFAEWNLEVDSSATASAQVNDGVCNIVIQKGGNNYSNVRLFQNYIPLFQGQNYVLEFDAWADENRVMEIKLTGEELPFKDYSRIGYIALTSTLKKFSYTFKMQESTDLNSTVMINAGASDKNIYIDNLSLKLDVPSKTNIELKTNNGFELMQNFPNPFSTNTKIEYYLPEASFVKLNIYNHVGQKVASYINKEQTSGNYSKEIWSNNLSPGIYFYSLQAKSVNSSKWFMETKKMILSK